MANAPRAFLNSGAWYELATAGQGVLFEVNPVDRFVFGAWYTFAPSGPADYRWFTFQKSNVNTGTGTLLDVPILETTGGRFDDGQAAVSTDEVPLQRVGPSPAECR